MSERAKIVTTDDEIDAAIRRARLFAPYERQVLRASYSPRTDRIMLHMDNGVVHSIPRKLMQGLADAAPSALQRIEILGSGTGLYWPALDVAHSATGLLSGVYGSVKWMKNLNGNTRNAKRPDAMNGNRRRAAESTDGYKRRRA